MFFYSFEPGRSFDLPAVVDAIGREQCDSGFLTWDAAARRKSVLKFLRDSRALLIWDNFESIHSMADRPLAEKQCNEIKDFCPSSEPKVVDPRSS